MKTNLISLKENFFILERSFTAELLQCDLTQLHTRRRVLLSTEENRHLTNSQRIRKFNCTFICVKVVQVVPDYEKTGLLSLYKYYFESEKPKVEDQEVN